MRQNTKQRFSPEYSKMLRELEAERRSTNHWTLIIACGVAAGELIAWVAKDVITWFARVV